MKGAVIVGLAAMVAVNDEVFSLAVISLLIIAGFFYAMKHK